MIAVNKVLAVRSVEMAVLALEQDLLFLALADLVMMETNVKVSIMHVNVKTRDWSLVMSIDYGRAPKLENHGFETFCAPSGHSLLCPSSY